MDKETMISPIPPLGQYWEGQGGKRFGEIRGENGQPDCWLIAACTPDGKLIHIGGAYSSRGKLIGAESRRDGSANMPKMLQNGSPLAKSAAAVEVDGHKDFYPPAQFEVNVFLANMPEYAAEFSWVQSSTEHDAHCAWCQHVDNGDQRIGYKGNDFGAFAVRRVPK
jgi:hypothetical protein